MGFMNYVQPLTMKRSYKTLLKLTENINNEIFSNMNIIRFSFIIYEILLHKIEYKLMFDSD